jgi:uncharacterized protein (DUF983 family)
MNNPPQKESIALNGDDSTLAIPFEHVYVRRGSPCPICGKGKMDFNGLLDLECDQCGYSLVEGAGCS